jgi:hypothetical protein
MNGFSKILCVIILAHACHLSAQDINIDTLEVFPSSLQIDASSMNVESDSIFINGVSTSQQELTAEATTIFVTTNNVLDLNPERDAISALQGAIRIRHTITDGSEVLDVSAGFPIPLTIASRVDGYTNSIINTVTNDGVGVVWWVIPSLGTGEYELKSTVTLPDDSFPIYDRYLSVTSAPSAAGDIFITNNVSVGDTSVTNIFQSGAFNISVTNIYNTGVETINSVDGNLTFEGSAVTQTGTVFNFSYVDTDDGFTNIATEGSGNVVTNLIYGGRVITQQLGTVSGGGGGGDVYLASNNTFTATNTFSGDLYLSADDFFARAGTGGDDSWVMGNRLGNVTAGSENFIFGGEQRATTISSSGKGNTILGGRQVNITAGDGNTLVGARGGTLSGAYANAVLGGQSVSVTGTSDGSVTLGGISLSITSSDESIVVGGENNTIASSQNSVILGGNFNNIASSSHSIAGGYDADASANYALAFGYAITNVHNGVHMFRTYDGDSTKWSSAATNTFIVKTGGFGINTNDPQADLHVAGEIRSDAGYIFPDGTTQTTASVSGGGGGLDHWASSNTTDATYLYPTGATHRQDYPYIVAFSNNGVSIGGVVPPTITSIGSVRVGGSGGTLSGSSSGALIAGGRDSSITGVGAQATIVGGRNHSITSGDEWTSILGGYENTLGGGRFGGTILGGRSASLTDGGSGCTIVGGYINSINTANGDYETVVGGYANSITSANDYNTVIGNQGCNITAGSWATIIGGYDADSTANYTFTSGYEINNTHAGTYMFRTYDGDATEWGSARTNSFIIKTGGVGINTNNPQADLHVNGMVQIDSVKVYASGTNLYLTDGSTFTNLITTTPL